MNASVLGKVAIGGLALTTFAFAVSRLSHGIENNREYKSGASTRKREEAMRHEVSRRLFNEVNESKRRMAAAMAEEDGK
jgi:hypothetical protein